ncbi:MAG: outer membrane beta-barrel protein [Bacteroidetes bacterium]|nr:outer membrane beta-barrel protein [Bacteroidota bacterium]MBU1116399.1 outer membrane beta-barrel protein [Bacteroidota bacterium]MBU1798679.1 outer membrane beta-barrel protein [Bacteroidota bacterium]
MRKTNQFILISILLFTFTFSSFAQTDTTKIDLAGKFALQFQISENFTLSSFQGGTFSGKYHLSNNSALRLGFSLYHNNDERMADDNYPSPDTTFNNRLNNNSTRVEVLLQYLQYANISNSISMFYGGGINYSSSLNNNKEYQKELSRFLEQSYYQVGINLLIGVEWFVRSNIGISAEYESGFSYSKNEIFYKKISETSDDKDGEKEERTMYRFSPNSVKFGLSIYF